MGPLDDREPGVRHYWGDAVRQLLVLAAVAIMLGSPFYTRLFGANLILNVFAVLVIVAFAALTSPLKHWVIMGDAVIAGLGVTVFGSLAIASYQYSLVDSVASLALSLVFLSAFYFSIKTLRAMLLRQIDADGDGQPDEEDEEPEPEEMPDDTPGEDQAEYEDLTAEEAEDERLIRHGGHIPVGDITDEAPPEDIRE
ncbi:hypothetical protein FJY94_04745 [Candidatus Kaiserbacteria bacterium]|nr:hypothetical protein [Candidatus Kaiserbacteria bacterium]